MAKLLGRTAAPIRDRVIGALGTLSPAWEAWFARLPDTLASIPGILKSVALDDQAATIAATDLTGGLLSKGSYRVTYHARISRAATSSSSLTVTIAWTEGGVAQSIAGAAMTGNTTTTRQNSVFMIRSDAATDVTYATTYASTGATTMQYSLDLSFEQIKI